MRSMCGVKLVDRKNMEELMEMLGLKETLDGIAKANEVRWYGHVMRREDDNVLTKAMTLEVNREAKTKAAKNDMKEASGRECEESWIED